MQAIVLDKEANGLYLQGDKLWYVSVKSVYCDKWLKLYPERDGYEKCAMQLKEFVSSFDDGVHFVGQNILGYDLWAGWKMLGIKPRVGKGGKDWYDDKQVQYVDTYVLSQYLNPDLPSHSLANLTTGSEAEKMDFRKALVEAGAMRGDEPKGFEFSFYHPIMDAYCDDDVLATEGLYLKLMKQAESLYKEWIHPSFRQMQKDYWLYSAQAFTGVKFDVEKAKSLVVVVEAEMAKIKAEVDPLLPPRPLKTAEQAFYKMPAKPYKKDGSMSSTFEKWLEKHEAVFDAETQVISAYSKEVKLQAGEVFPVELPMEIEDNSEMKDWFIAEGWQPSDDFWNFKRGADGKPERDMNGKLIKTTPKIQHQGNICPNLLKLEGEIPKKVVKFLSYRNRLGIVRGWLENWRIEFDGRLSAEISGYAPTSRVKHRTVCNVPKADIKVLLGNEMRDLFTVDEGNWYLGTDAAALENRTLSHYTFKHDGGKFAHMNLEGDIHTFNAFAFFPHLHELFDINDPELKENPAFKPWRNKAKTGAYLLAFGGGAPKLASSLGLSKSEGKDSYENYWTMNEGLGKLKEAVEKYYTTTGKNKHIPAIDGRLVSVRGKNVLLSCLGQGLGAICMSYAACLMDTWLGEMYIDNLGRPYYLYNGKKVKRVSMVHRMLCL